jgi:hypothetical protein
MMRNMSVLGMVFHLRKIHVENVSGVRNGTWHEKKVHRRKHMDHQILLGDTEGESDIHHRETGKKCKKPYEQLLPRQLNERNYQGARNTAISERLDQRLVYEI